MKSLASLGLAVLMLLASGCVVSAQPPDEPMYISSEDLWTEPDRYDGEYVAVTGQLHERNYLFFEDSVTTNNIRPVIYIRPDYRDMDTPAVCRVRVVQTKWYVFLVVSRKGTNTNLC